MIREGLTVAIVGRPNAGKSSLFNRLAGAARAIVTDVPGTTRDLLTERVDIGGVPLTIVDTAGLRAAPAMRSRKKASRGRGRRREAADVLIVVLDRSRRLRRMTTARCSSDSSVEDARARRQQSDLPGGVERAGRRRAAGVRRLTDRGDAGVARGARWTRREASVPRDRAAVANMRHVALLEKARDALSRAAAAAADGVPEEFVLADLHDARAAVRRDHGGAAAGRSAARDLRALLYREIITITGIWMHDGTRSSSSGRDTPASKRRGRRRGWAATSRSAR